MDKVIIPQGFHEKNKEKLEEAGLKQGVDYEVSENLPSNPPEKMVTLRDLYLYGNRHQRRKALAILRKK